MKSLMHWFGYSFMAFMLTFVSARAAPKQTVASVGCPNADFNETAETSGPLVPADISPLLRGKISLYVDQQQQMGAFEGTFAPANWACQVFTLPNSYSLDIAPSADELAGDDPTSLSGPLVAQQIFSADGSVPQAVGFYALAATIFPKYFPGGINKWVGDPLRSNGENPTEAQIKSIVPVGPNQIVLRVSDQIIEFITPPNAKGLGTVPFAEADQEPKMTTYGLVGLFLEHGVPITAEMFSFRLPPGLVYLRQPLIKLSEQELKKDFSSLLKNPWRPG